MNIGKIDWEGGRREDGRGRRGEERKRRGEEYNIRYNNIIII